MTSQTVHGVDHGGGGPPGNDAAHECVQEGYFPWVINVKGHFVEESKVGKVYHAEGDVPGTIKIL